MYLLIDCFLLSLFAHYHRRRIRQKRRQRSSLLVGGRNCFKFNNALELLHQDDLKKRMNKRKDTWRNGCFGKMDAHPVHTIPNHQATKMNVLPKTFLQIILAAKWLVGIQCPSNSSDVLLFCLILLICTQHTSLYIVSSQNCRKRTGFSSIIAFFLYEQLSGGM